MKHGINLISKKKDAELHIVGPLDEQMKEYLKQRKKNETIIWHGGVAHEKLASLYQQASLFVLPSLQEGLAMVLIEAMASGLPLLATNRTGAEDIIIDAQQGFIIDSSNSNLLAEKIAWGFENQDELFEMGQKGAIQAKKYTWDLYGDAVTKKYEEILNQSFYENESRKERWKSV
ncbi:glycosyltransferase family 4 protein [Candidatus Babeliales bacterium]|nr:glycosyltransferase family 4 protein [Candidatus Babeliales bacterium]